MKKTGLFAGLFLVLIAISQVNAQETEKCFANSGLKDGHEIRYTLRGRTVTGVFSVERGFDKQMSKSTRSPALLLGC